MTAPVYGREALRRLREQQAHAADQRDQPSLLELVPADTPADNATITVWNGERFVTYDKWLATAPLVVQEQSQKEQPAVVKRADADLSANCPARDSAVQKGLWDSHAEHDLNNK
jgi:hypothetical protein